MFKTLFVLAVFVAFFLCVENNREAVQLKWTYLWLQTQISLGFIACFQISSVLHGDPTHP